MELSCYAESLLDIEAGAVVLFCFKDDKPHGDELEKVDLLSGGVVSDMFAREEFNGSLEQTVMLRSVPESTAGSIILAGLGPEKEIHTDFYRQAAGRVSQMALRHKISHLALYYNGPDTRGVIQAMVEGVLLGSYQFLDFKTDEKARKEVLKRLDMVVPQRGRLRAAESGMQAGEIVASAVNMARDLGSRPGNDLYPESYGKYAQKIAREANLKCRVLTPSQIKSEKMGALLSVGQGSANQPRFVILEYNGGRVGSQPVVLVGKGITFDSGGISLKPGLNMEEMKGDMLGSAVVLAVIAAAAKLKAKINLVALMPLAENMPSGIATRPGDIVKSRAGHTIEIINTDAEGRLILADALDFADKFNPQAVIDIATLTGAALYILGYAGAPFVGTNTKLNDNLRMASEKSGEKIWELPLWSEFSKLMDSSIADIKNSGGRPAGTITAASFLKKFIGDWPWLHIDIAYCDIEPSGRPYVPKGMTGFGVRLLLDLILNWKKVK